MYLDGERQINEYARFLIAEPENFDNVNIDSAQGAIVKLKEFQKNINDLLDVINSGVSTSVK